jgi:hypothetical protein
MDYIYIVREDTADRMYQLSLPTIYDDYTYYRLFMKMLITDIPRPW